MPSNSAVRLTAPIKSQSLAEKKKAQWNEEIKKERDPQNTFTTTYKERIGSPAEDPNTLKTAFIGSDQGRKTAQWGESTHSFQQDHIKMDLRSPVPLELSPFAEKK